MQMPFRELCNDAGYNYSYEYIENLQMYLSIDYYVTNTQIEFLKKRNVGKNNDGNKLEIYESHRDSWHCIRFSIN